MSVLPTANATMLSEFTALTLLISFPFLSFSCQAEGDPEERLLVFHKQLTQAHAPPYSKGKRDVGIGFFLYVVLMITPRSSHTVQLRVAAHHDVAEKKTMCANERAGGIFRTRQGPVNWAYRICLLPYFPRISSTPRYYINDGVKWGPAPKWGLQMSEKQRAEV